MYPLDVIQAVRLITDVCLEVAPGQDVLCIADREENMEILTLIAAECRARGAEVGVVLITTSRPLRLLGPCGRRMWSSP